MSTPNVIATVNNTNVIVTISTNNQNASSDIVTINDTIQNAVVVQEDYPFNYISGSGIQLQANVIHNTGVLSFNNRRGNIILTNEDINNALIYIDGGTP